MNKYNSLTSGTKSCLDGGTVDWTRVAAELKEISGYSRSSKSINSSVDYFIFVLIY